MHQEVSSLFSSHDFFRSLAGITPQFQSEISSFVLEEIDQVTSLRFLTEIPSITRTGISLRICTEIFPTVSVDSFDSLKNTCGISPIPSTLPSNQVPPGVYL